MSTNILTQPNHLYWRNVRKEILAGPHAGQIAEAWVAQQGPKILELVEASRAVPLSRYTLRSGKIYGKPGSKERYKIIELSGNTIIYKDLQNYHVEYVDVEDLLEFWNKSGIVEISPLDNILQWLKQHLAPLLGPVLVAALISWILSKTG